MNTQTPWERMINWLSGTGSLRTDEDPSQPPPVNNTRSILVVPHDASSLSREQLVDKIKGTVFGNALGDALGLSTEFMSRKSIAEFYGDKEITFDNFKQDGHRRRWKKGDWTDDTDQMILILNSILHHGGKPEARDFAKRLKFWIGNGFLELGDVAGMGVGSTVGAVVSQKEFEESPHICAESVWLKSDRQLAANGAVMRTSITGVPSFFDLNAVEKQTIDICKVTHADPRCISSSVAVAVAIATMLQGLPQDEVLQISITRASAYISDGQDSKNELMKYIQPQSVESLQLDESQSIGYTYKAMGCGFYALTAENSDWKDILMRIIREGGDADTNAAVAGAMLGCKVGYSKLPLDLVNQMPNKEWLDQKVNLLLKLMSLSA